MDKLIINGGCVTTRKTEIIGVYRAIAYCACCNEKVAIDIWADLRLSPTCTMSPPEDYIRIIFGIHPEIYSAQNGPVPAVFTPVYFCKECEENNSIVASLLKMFLSFDPMIHPSTSDSQFDPKRGCWITIWPLDKQSQPTWPIDYQVNLSTFREITKKLMNIPNNPFRVFRR